MERFVHGYGVLLAAGLKEPSRPVLDRELRRAVRGLADEHRAALRCLLDSKRRVDDVAGRDPLARPRCRGERDDRFARCQGDANSGQGVADREGGADRALGIVLVRHRRTEHGHHCVADVLLERAAVALELLAHSCDLRTDGRAHVFGIALVRAGRGVHDVREEHGDDLALLTGPCGDCRPAVRAVTGAVREVRAALATGSHAPRIGPPSPSNQGALARPSFYAYASPFGATGTGSGLVGSSPSSFPAL